MDPEYKRARSQYASMWAGKWAQNNTTIKQEKAANLMSENTNQSQANSSPIPTPVNNTSPYPTSFPESLVFSNYDSSNNMTQSQTYAALSSNTGMQKMDNIWPEQSPIGTSLMCLPPMITVRIHFGASCSLI